MRVSLFFLLFCFLFFQLIYRRTLEFRVDFFSPVKKNKIKQKINKNKKFCRPTCYFLGYKLGTKVFFGLMGISLIIASKQKKLVQNYIPRKGQGKKTAFEISFLRLCIFFIGSPGGKGNVGPAGKKGRLTFEIGPIGLQELKERKDLLVYLV